VLYGGYLNSTQAGRLYFNNGVTVVAGQVSETADAIAKAKEIAVAVINQNLWSAYWQRCPNYYSINYRW